LKQTLVQATIVAFLTGSCWPATWVIVRKDGQRIECNGPFVIINGVYTFRGTDGKDGTLQGSEVNAEQTAAANAARTTAVPAARQSAPPIAIPTTAETTRPTKGDPYIDRPVCWANLGNFSAAKRDLMTAHALPSREEWLDSVDKWLLNYSGK
jgi:hypothetical protein